MAGIPKGRPRVTRGHAYTPARTRMFESAISLYFKTQYASEPQTGPLVLTLDFAFQKPKKPTRSYPTRCGDLDNLTKSVCDAANRILFEDDSQIVKQIVSKRWAAQDTIGISLWAPDIDGDTNAS